MKLARKSWSTLNELAGVSNMWLLTLSIWSTRLARYKPSISSLHPTNRARAQTLSTLSPTIMYRTMIISAESKKRRSSKLCWASSSWRYQAHDASAPRLSHLTRCSRRSLWWFRLQCSLLPIQTRSQFWIIRQFRSGSMQAHGWWNWIRFRTNCRKIRWGTPHE